MAFLLANPNRGTRLSRRARALWCACSVALVIGTPTAVGAVADEERQELRSNRDERNELGGEIEDVEHSIEQLEGLIEGLDVQLVVVGLELLQAEAQLEWAHRHVTEAQLQVAQAVVEEVRARRDFEVALRAAYVRPPGDLVGGYLLADSSTEAGRRDVLLGAVVASEQDEADRVAELRTRREGAQAAAADVMELAAASRSQVAELKLELARVREQHVVAQADLEGRLEELREEVEALAAEEAQLVALIRRLEAEAARASGTPPSSLIWPAAGWVSSEFGPRWGRRHLGIDLAAPTGTAVKAAGSGVVTHAGPLGSFGNLVMIDHGGGVVTLYAHLHRVDVRVDQSVEVGVRIATVGSTGRSTGPHLHFEVRRRGTAVNPRTLLR